MARYGIPDDPALRTASRLRACWLHYVRGYRVLEIRRRPHQGWFGRIGTEEVYTLLPRQKAMKQA